MNDAFSTCHPSVCLLFFAGAIGCGVVFQHPVYLLISVLAALSCYLWLGKGKALRSVGCMMPVILLLACLNPVFNTRGATVLFLLFGRPYTLEALVYGLALSGVMLTSLLWLGCCNYVLTGDKVTCLFGNIVPTLSLLLVMVFRMVPSLIRKTEQIFGARKAIGKGAGESAAAKEKLRDGMTVLGSLLAWALEGSVMTADSMRARGYGTAKRQSFRVFRMETRDWLLIGWMILLLLLIFLAAALGQLTAVYTPYISIAPVSWGAFAYGIFLWIPMAQNIKETIVWHIFKSKI